MNRRVEALRDAFYELFRSGEDPEDAENGLGTDALLGQIDFYSLLQSLLHEAEKVYEFRADSELPMMPEYRGRELFPSDAVRLYADTFSVDFDAVDTEMSHELWYLPDNTFAVTTCFQVLAAEGRYITEYRVFKGTDWTETEMCINFPELAMLLRDKCEPVIEHEYPIYDL